MKNWGPLFYVRFKYQSKTYPIKNFIKIYGCKNVTQTKNKLAEIKHLISSGKNPFIKTNSTINDLWLERIERKNNNQEWSENTSTNYNYYSNTNIKPIIGHNKMTNIKIYEGKRVSIHDTRRLMLSIMITECGIDSVLADKCLSHKQKGVIEHYLSFTYKDIKKSYKKYWKKVRN